MNKTQICSLLCVSVTKFVLQTWPLFFAKGHATPFVICVITGDCVWESEEALGDLSVFYYFSCIKL